METLLILIGFGCLCWFASKFFNGLGNALDSISKKMEDRSLSAVQLQYRQEKVTRKLEKTVKKLHAIKEAEAYEARVKKEIEEITK
jgi:tRNA U54 and U55 pseudouridine synthase Pus10